jgi:hypothetical protein
MPFRLPFRTRLAPIATGALVLASAAVASGTVAERPAARLRAAQATPGSFTARATGVERGDRVRVAVSTWDAEGRRARGMRVTVRVAGAARRWCGRTNRRGRTACRVPARRTRPAVFVAAGNGPAVRIRFWRYRGD